jgi:hypothetical protein
MSKVLGLAGFFALAAGIASADTVIMGSESWTNMPVSISGDLGTNQPYWDNVSGDGTNMNGGFLLTGTCGVSGDCNSNYGPLQYLSQNNGVGQPDAPTDITLAHTGTAPIVTLLANFTKDTTITFGFYDLDLNPLPTLFPLFGPGSLQPDIGNSLSLAMANNDQYGFYITRACYGLIAGCSGGYTTWYSNSSLDTTDVGKQHFAIFDSSTAGLYYVAVEDWTPNTAEGYGDFNDIVFELNTDPVSAVPEPATLGLMGAGLAALGLVRLRARKNRQA